MSKQNSEPLSPTVNKVINEYIRVLRDDNTIDNGIIKNLDNLLRKGVLPKSQDIAAVLFSPPNDEQS